MSQDTYTIAPGRRPEDSIRGPETSAISAALHRKLRAVSFLLILLVVLVSGRSNAAR